jgi:hypothetical protein
MRSIVFLILFSLLSNGLQAQFIEVGGHVGAVTYLGDLAPKVDVGSAGDISPGFTLYGRLGLLEGINARLSVSRFTLKGDDKDADGFSRLQRNLSFRSNLYEAALSVEVFPLSGLESRFLSTFQPYFHGGAALFTHNPQAELDGTWYDLQPLRTEGQGTSAAPDQSPYSRTGLAVPFGLGFTIFLDKNVTIGMEVNFRKTFTDYLDDVSTNFADPRILETEVSALSARLANRTSELGSDAAIDFRPGAKRGDPDNKDWYIFMGITVGTIIDDGGRRGRWWGTKRLRSFYY